jgi:general secretion pathway protein L
MDGRLVDTLRLVWDWWREQLLDLVPGYAARQRSKAEDGVILSDLGAEGSTVAVSERIHGVETPLGRVALTQEEAEPVRLSAARNRLPILLRLAGPLLLEREVTLPIAAERELGRVLFYEMDRYTPFSGGDVVWTYLVRLRDRANGKLVVRLSLIQKAAIAAVMQAMGQAGLAIAGIEMVGQDGQNRRIPLDSNTDVRGRPDWLLRPTTLAAAALLVIAIVLPFILQSHAQAEVERRIAAAAPVVARVQALRHAVDATSTGTDVIAAERRRAGDALEAIALLTDALPDDTYLTALTFDAGKLTMDGQSKSAAALIVPLTANRRVQDASFTAPVIRNTLNMDTFSMRLRVTR